MFLVKVLASDRLSSYRRAAKEVPPKPASLGGQIVPTINLNALNSQVTVGTPGNYSINIDLLTVNPKVIFSGVGTYTVTNVASLLASYTIEATAGATVNIGGLASVASTANLQVDGSSTMSLGTGISALTAINASFTGSGAGKLVLNPSLLGLLNTPPNISGFGGSDMIELGGTTGDGFTYTTSFNSSTGNLTLLRNGFAAGVVKLNGSPGSYGTGNFVVGSDSSGNVAIDFVPCFLRGTRIATPSGPRTVEELAIGDLVALATGGTRPVKWIGYRSYNPLFANANSQLVPVRIMAGALSDGIPARDLVVSPNHALFINGVLIHAIELVNGRSIVQQASDDTIAYVHVELDRHDIILAEGTPTESYIEFDNRGVFQNVAEYYGLYGSETEAPTQNMCAPLANRTPLADAARARIAARAGLEVRQTDAVGPLVGFVDSIVDGVVSGWAMDVADRARPVMLEVLAGELIVAVVAADRYRADVASTGTTGRQGFIACLPRRMWALPIAVRRLHDGTVLDGVVSTGVRAA
jgi:hypothetical protein